MILSFLHLSTGPSSFHQWLAHLPLSPPG
jgi:hypothetical protein